MPVLLLCQGDSAAKDLLRQVITARYGSSPPAIEQLQILFKGYIKMPIDGELVWTPLKSKATFYFPDKLRWDFVSRPENSPKQSGVDAFDGTTYRTQRHGESEEIQVLDSTMFLHSARSRLWALACTLLTPISDFHVEVMSLDAYTILVKNSQLDTAAMMTFRTDGSIKSIETKCTNPYTDTYERYVLKLPQEYDQIGDLMMPVEIKAQWDDVPFFQLQVADTRLHHLMATGLFRLDSVG